MFITCATVTVFIVLLDKYISVFITCAAIILFIVLLDTYLCECVYYLCSNHSVHRVVGHIFYMSVFITWAAVTVFIVLLDT